MDLELLHDALPAAIRLAAGDPDLDVGWEEEEARWRATPHVRISPIAVRAIGQDERRIDPDTGAVTVYGARAATLQVAVEAQFQRASGAAALAERIRTVLAREDVRDLLRASSVAFVRADAIRPMTFTDPDGRRVSVHAFDLAVNVGVAYASDAGLVDFVEEVVVDGTVVE